MNLTCVVYKQGPQHEAGFTEGVAANAQNLVVLAMFHCRQRGIRNVHDAIVRVHTYSHRVRIAVLSEEGQSEGAEVDQSNGDLTKEYTAVIIRPKHKIRDCVCVCVFLMR